MDIMCESGRTPVHQVTVWKQKSESFLILVKQKSQLSQTLWAQRSNPSMSTRSAVTSAVIRVTLHWMKDVQQELSLVRAAGLIRIKFLLRPKIQGAGWLLCSEQAPPAGHSNGIAGTSYLPAALSVWAAALSSFPLSHAVKLNSVVFDPIIVLPVFCSLCFKSHCYSVLLHFRLSFMQLTSSTSPPYLDASAEPPSVVCFTMTTSF